MEWIGAFAIGLSLGLLGSGGSILTVPVLIYLVKEPEKVAIAESLAIVGLIAAAGALPRAFRGLVEWRTVALFGVPGMVGAYFGAWAAVLVSAAFQLVVFACIMLVASAMMYRPPKLSEPDKPREARAAWKIAIDGVVVGAITGLVGVGGGFLIVPALVLMGGLTMHQAVGTSLAIIALKSAAGFLKYQDVLNQTEFSLNWALIGSFAGIGFLGTLFGAAVGDRLPKHRLQQGFAVFLAAMGALILWQYAPNLRS